MFSRKPNKQIRTTPPRFKRPPSSCRQTPFNMHPSRSVTGTSFRVSSHPSGPTSRKRHCRIMVPIKPAPVSSLDARQSPFRPEAPPRRKHRCRDTYSFSDYSLFEVRCYHTISSSSMARSLAEEQPGSMPLYAWVRSSSLSSVSSLFARGLLVEFNILIAVHGTILVYNR